MTHAPGEGQERSPRAEGEGSDSRLGASSAVQEFFGAAYGNVAGFDRLLREQGEQRGLIGPREVERLWERHLLNSAALVQYLPDSGTVIDVGSGAGLPGIIVAMMRPDLDVVLIEPMERRTTWLSEVVETFGLKNVTVRRGRAEEYHGALEADVVTSRAVANLAKLARMSMPLVRRGGRMVVLKGRNAANEIEPARVVLRKFRADEPELLRGITVVGVEPTTVVSVRRG